MKFTFKGLVGFMLDNEASHTYSVVSIGTLFAAHSGLPDDPGVQWTACMYFIFCLAAPSLLVLLCGVLWFAPLSSPWRRFVLTWCEVVNAWAALEVFVVAVVASMLQVQQFAAFIVGDACDGVNKLLEALLDEQLHGDDKCLDVIAELTSVMKPVISIKLYLFFLH
jgi:hypothetical protein